MPKISIPTAPSSCKVYTPYPLACAMSSALGDMPDFSWLEPCVGYGVFLKALKAQGIRRTRITAIDLDAKASPSDKLAKVIRGTDFLAWAQTTEHRFDRIIGNPPYVAISKLPNTLRDCAAQMSDPDGNTVGAKSNYWLAFFCASLGLLREGGGLCFVLPASWDYADYATGIRDFIFNQFSNVEVFRSKRPIFDPLQDGCIVVLADGFRKANRTIKRFEYVSGKDLINSLSQPRHRQATSLMTKVSLTPQTKFKTIQLKEIIDISLGGVTGDVNFFLLTEAERIERKLPIDTLIPVVSKSKHLRASAVTKRLWDQLRASNERVWLFSPSPNQLKRKAVERYLKLSSQEGGCRRNRLKILLRDPWYQTPLPLNVDGFISGMIQAGPWISLNRMQGLNATNTIYTIKFKKRLTLDQKAAWALSFLSSYTFNVMISIGRIYASGLRKFEPGDLLKLPLIIPKKEKEANKKYVFAIERLLKDDALAARKIADRFLGIEGLTKS